MTATGAGKGWYPSLLRALLEEHAARLHRHRRQRIRLGARRIERTNARHARDSEVPLGLRVVRLQVGVGDGPIGKAGARNGAFLAGLDEVDFVEAPVVRGEVHGAAANHASVEDCRLLDGLVRRSLAEGHRLLLRVVGQQRLRLHAILVVRELFAIEPGPLLQSDHAETIARKLARQHAAGRAASDDEEVNFVGELVTALLRLGAHAFSFMACSS